MAIGYPHNFVRIILHPIKDSRIRLEVQHDTVNCRAGFEDLICVVDWTNAGSSWLSVCVGEFKAGGDTIGTDKNDLVFRRSEPNTVGKLSFSEFVTAKKPCKYEIHYHREDTAEIIVLDPTVILRPGDWVPETDP